MLRSNSAQQPALAVVEPQPEDAGGNVPKAVFKVSRQHFPSALAFELPACRVSWRFVVLLRDLILFETVKLDSKLFSVSDDFRI